MVDSTLKNANILIVDDKQANIDILTGLLEIRGYKNIKTITDPRLAVRLFQSFKPDLILLDLMMPHLTGFEVMEQLKTIITSDTYLPILVLTADITVEAKQHALSGGAKDFLAKPFDLIEVDLRIKNLLETRYLHQRLENQNQILEEKVKDRTLELENTNIELIAAKDKAEESNRLKSAFLHLISHEIRTPLNQIVGFGQLLVEPDLTQKEKDEYLKALQSGSNRLIKTVTDYIDIALIVSGAMEVREEVFSPVHLLDATYNKFLTSCKDKNLTLTVQTPPPQNFFENNIQIKSDHALLRKVLSYLVDNAIKFTEQGTVSYGFQIKENELEFFVRDTGVGISETACAHIFDTFMQEDASLSRGYEGNGLELSIAKKFMELIGGRIWFESVKGEGSVFYFTIPYDKR